MRFSGIDIVVIALSDNSIIMIISRSESEVNGDRIKSHN